MISPASKSVRPENKWNKTLSNLPKIVGLPKMPQLQSKSKTEIPSFHSLRTHEHRLLSANRSLRLVLLMFGILFVICMVSLLWGIIQACFHPQQTANENLSTAITALNLQYQDVHRQVTANGAASAWESIAISPEINGLKIDAVLVKEGDHVKREQPLACLNDSVLRADLQEAQAGTLASKANLQKSIQPNRIEEIASLRAAVAQAKDLIDQALSNVESAQTRCLNAEEIAKRYTNLQIVGAVTEVEAHNSFTEATALRAEFNKAKQQVQVAKESYKQAQEHLKLAINGGSKEDVSVSQATLLQAHAKVNRLEALLAQTIIRAPEDGLIVKCEARHGEIAIAGQPIFTLVRDNRLELKVNVPESQLLLIHPGQTAQIRTRRESKDIILGKVREVSPSVDAISRLGTVRIDLPKSDSVIPGMFFHVDIDTAKDHVLALPKEAILDNEGQSYVYVVENNRVKKVNIVLGEDFDNNLEIKSGLQSGQKIAISGASFLKDGDRVNIIDHQ